MIPFSSRSLFGCLPSTYPGADTFCPLPFGLLLAQAQDHCKGDTAFPGLQFGSSRTFGIAQHMSCTDLAKFNLQIHSLVLLFFGTSFGLGSGHFRLSRIILLLVLAWKQRGSLCPLSSVVVLPGLCGSNSWGFIHFCRMEVG